MTKWAAAKMGLAKVVVQYSTDTFMVNHNLVLGINIWGKNPDYHESAKRQL